jgi:hypothetical protein
MSFEFKFMLSFVAVTFVFDANLGEPVTLYSALYLSIFMYIQQRTGGFAYIVAPSDTQLTTNPATGLPMQQPGATFGYDVGGHQWGTND